MKQIFLMLSVLCILMSSCMSKKKVLYFQNSELEKELSESNYELKIQPDDILQIEISSIDPEAAAVFNRNANSFSNPNSNLNVKEYLVDSKGFIEFPVLGKMRVEGYTKTELIDLFKTQLKLYLKDPAVYIRIINFKVTVLGEVKNPGTFVFNSEKVSLSELIGKAGDLTLQGKRNNILIVRDEKGTKSFHNVDFSKASIVNSPQYYLHQNDVVYVEPRKNKIDSGAIPPVLTNSISVLSILLTTFLLIRGIKF